MSQSPGRSCLIDCTRQRGDCLTGSTGRHAVGMIHGDDVAAPPMIACDRMPAGRERADLLTLALALAIVPLTWWLLLGWSWSRDIAGHDELASLNNLLSIREIVETGEEHRPFKAPVAPAVPTPFRSPSQAKAMIALAGGPLNREPSPLARRNAGRAERERRRGRTGASRSGGTRAEGPGTGDSVTQPPPAVSATHGGRRPGRPAPAAPAAGAASRPACALPRSAAGRRSADSETRRWRTPVAAAPPSPAGPGAAAPPVTGSALPRAHPPPPRGPRGKRPRQPGAERPATASRNAALADRDISAGGSGGGHEHRQLLDELQRIQRQVRRAVGP